LWEVISQMAFQVPKFNIWLEAFTQPVIGSIENGFTRGQIRGPRPTMIGRVYNLALTTYDQIYVEILVPAGTDIRSYQFASDRIGTGAIGNDYVKPLGRCNVIYLVQDVFDVGAGFPNEFRVLVCRTEPTGGQPDDPLNGGLARVNPDLVPPDGYTPTPVMPRAPADE